MSSTPTLTITASKARTVRFEALDGLRGIAALVVVLSHCTLLYETLWNTIYLHDKTQGLLDPVFWITRTPLSMFVSGTQAVYIFFVLSGFVLTLTFTKGDGNNILPYLCKRIPRLWLPMAFAVSLSAIIFTFVHRPPLAMGQSDWCGYCYVVHPFSLVFQQLSLTDASSPMNALDPPTWSLVHEMRISIVLPAIIFALIRWRSLALAASSLLSLAAVMIMHRIQNPLILNLVDSLQYICLFAIGAAIYLSLQKVRSFLIRLPKFAVPAGWCISIILFILTYRQDVFLLHAQWKIVASIAATIMMIVAVDSRRNVVLMSRPVLWLGKVSYSLYLVHTSILLSTLYICGGRLPLLIPIAITIPVSLLAAEGMNRWIERPSQSIGRQLAAKAVSIWH
jgi:peptidoglycan/LPS O-acetylase OafA/YrhL